jgi:gliding motility-associated-like protein
MRKLIRCLFLLMICTGTVRATHIVGGEIYYDYQGGDNYRITLKVYRDCYNGQPPYDNPAYIFIFNNTGSLVDSIPVTFPGSRRLPPIINSLCFSAPLDICVEEAVYTKVVHLLPAVGGYDITYQRCCRNNAILNLTDAGNTGSTYLAHIPDPSLAIGNSCPHFKQFPPLFICANNPLIFDHSAIDPDGDSLVYYFDNAYDGASSCCPILGPGAGSTCGTTCPVIPPAPPCVSVNYIAPYNGKYPLSSAPALAIDPHTGLITGTPNMIGRWVVAVCCSEYRHGKLLSTNKRDFQFNVTPCPPIPVSSVPAQKQFCFGDTVSFINNSVNSTSYLWNFGDSNAGSDTSSLLSPMHIYSDSGVYHVTLICNPGTPCADTGHTTFYIYPLLKPSFAHPDPQCITGNHFNFAAGGHFMGNGSFLWTFGSKANPDTSSQKNPTGIQYSSSGSFPITLNISENGCQHTYTDTVLVLAPPSLTASLQSFKGCAPLTANFLAPPVDPLLNPTFMWSFGDGVKDNTPNPIHTYTQPGSYNLGLIINTSKVCIDTFRYNRVPAITVYPLPEASFKADSISVMVTNPSLLFTNLGKPADSVLACVWNFGDGTVLHNCYDSIRHVFPEKDGYYQVYEMVTNRYGCIDTMHLQIDVYPVYAYWVPNAFTPNGDGLNDIFKPVIQGVEKYRFYIFNRWGELIYESDDTEAGWNGTYKGNKCQIDVYVWKVDFMNKVSRRNEHYIGRVSLVR